MQKLANYMKIIKLLLHTHYYINNINNELC